MRTRRAETCDLMHEMCVALELGHGLMVAKEQSCCYLITCMLLAHQQRLRTRYLQAQLSLLHCFVLQERGVVLLWVTNRERLHTFIRQELLPAWGLAHVATWVGAG